MHDWVQFRCNYIVKSHLLSKIFKRKWRCIAFALVFTHACSWSCVSFFLAVQCHTVFVLSHMYLSLHFGKPFISDCLPPIVPRVFAFPVVSACFVCLSLWRVPGCGLRFPSHLPSRDFFFLTYISPCRPPATLSSYTFFPFCTSPAIATSYFLHPSLLIPPL